MEMAIEIAREGNHVILFLFLIDNTESPRIIRTFFYASLFGWLDGRINVKNNIR